MSDPVAQGVLHEVRHMKTSKKTAGKTATKTNGGAQGAAKGNGYWRETRCKGERVLIDPAGRIFHGTAQEVREAALTPERRDELAQSIEWARHTADKFGYTPEQRREYICEKRREELRRNDYWTVAPYHAHIKQELGIVAEAAARYMGQTVEAFIADALFAAIRGTMDIAERDAGEPGVGLPITRHERAALDRIMATRPQIEAEAKARLAERATA